MSAPVLHILPLTVIRKQRLLPIPGRVTVRQGQKVGARDVIAEANLTPEHILLNIARSLRVSIEQADYLTQCEADDDVSVGDLIAGPTGITKRVVRAPVNGRIKLVGEGQVLIQVDKQPNELHAGISGTVVQLIPDTGAVIETTGALIQGVWGNGHADFGLMQVKMEAPDDELTAEQVDVSLRGSIILGGYCQDPELLKKAAEVPIRGLVLASMPSVLMPIASRMDYPIIVMEGFGRLPLNPISYNLLTTHQNREISLNAEPFDTYSGQRPEIIIPLPTSSEPNLPIAVEEFAEGQRVRISRKPYQARTGTIDLLYNGPVKFPSGIRTPAAQISLEEGESVKVPLANLEIIT
jgi:hypothetical protein